MTPFLFKRFFPLFLLIAALSCNNEKEAPDVSAIKTDITIHRFDKDFFSLDTSIVKSSILGLSQKYPVFLPLYFQFFVDNISHEEDDSLFTEEKMQAIKAYHNQFKPLYDSVEKRFPNLATVEKGLKENLRYVQYYFPSFKIPDVFTSVEGFHLDPEAIYGTSYSQNMLVISLQMFLGKNFVMYNPSDYPDYLRRRFEPAFIVPNSIRAIAGEIYRDTSQTFSLVEQMIEKGKQWWLMKKFLPYTPDSLITGYTSDQSKWLATEEGNVWGSINQNENLFSVEQSAIQAYIGEAPFTQTLPHGNNGEGAPGNIGPWIGWRIIAAYEARTKDASVAQILQTSARQIFEGAKYKPK